MKKIYNANELYIGQLFYVSSNVTEYGVTSFTTQQKYIFTKKSRFVKRKSMNHPKYHEIFTNYSFGLAESQTKDNITSMTFNLPYIVSLEPFTKYFPLTANKTITHLSLLVMMDNINFKKDKDNTGIKER